MYSPPSSSPFKTVADPRPVDVCSTAAGRALFSLPALNWVRYSSEYDNPLADLYEVPLKQWQLGVDEQGRCVLVFYDRTAYNGIGEWVLATDGRVMHERPDIPQAPASVEFRKHFFSPMAQLQSLLQFFDSLQPPQWGPLAATMALRPEVTGTIKSMLFAMLESQQAVGDSQAEAQQNALNTKIDVVSVFKHLVSHGLLNSPHERQRLKRGIARLMETADVTSLMPLRSQLMDGIWWLRLQQEVL